MIRIISTVGIALTLALYTIPGARADGATLRNFLTQSEGDYTGQGTRITRDASGTEKMDYSVEFNLAQADDGSFTAESSVNDDNGGIHGSTDILVVRGGNLYTGTQVSSSFPVRVLKSTANSLEYSFSAVNPVSGLPYDFTVSYNLNGDTLSRHSVTRVNGVVVTDDDFTASRF